MGADLVAEQTIIVGEPIAIEGSSPHASFGVVFEDDGSTGYLYGLDFSRKENPIVDAMQIYDVAQITDREKPSLVQLVWSGDGLKAAIVINNYPHAVFDFESRRGYCRTGYPPPDRSWTDFDHSWDDNAMDLFR